MPVYGYTYSRMDVLFAYYTYVMYNALSMPNALRSPSLMNQLQIVKEIDYIKMTGLVKLKKYLDKIDEYLPSIVSEAFLVFVLSAFSALITLASSWVMLVSKHGP